MWSVQKKLTALLVVAVMVKVVLTKNDKFRFITKTVENCGDSGLTMTLKDVQKSFKNKGLVRTIKTKIEVSEDTEIKSYGMVLFKDGQSPTIIARLESTDFCEKVKEAKTVYLEPAFISGDIPRTCKFEKGVYPLVADIDVLIDRGNNPDSLKGVYHYNYTFGDGMKNVLCVTGYGDLKAE